MLTMNLYIWYELYYILILQQAGLYGIDRQNLEIGQFTHAHSKAVLPLMKTLTVTFGACFLVKIL